MTFAQNHSRLDSDLVKEEPELVDIYMDERLDIDSTYLKVDSPQRSLHYSKKLKRCSLGISMSDLQDLTEDNISKSKRSSLDMLFSIEERGKLPGEEACRSTTSRKRSSLAMNTYYGSRRQSQIGSIYTQNDISCTDHSLYKIKTSSLISTEAREELQVSSFLHPVQSLLCSSKYQVYLRTLINLMEKSEESRMKMKKIKRHYCQQNTKDMEKSFVHTNIQHPRKRKRSLDTSFHVEKDFFATPISRRRSSIITQSFKLQFFPEND